MPSKGTDSRSKDSNRSNKAKSSTKKPVADELPSSIGQVSLDLQQRLLDVFQRACVDTIDEDLPAAIQEVKQHLYNRDFVQAFGTEAYRSAYAARWSPSRALAYLQILQSLPDVRDMLFSKLSITKGESPQISSTVEAGPVGNAVTESAASELRLQENVIPSEDSVHDSQPKRIVCLGAGGGAELVALAGLIHLGYQEQIIGTDAQDVDPVYRPQVSPFGLQCVLVDVADWSKSSERIFTALTTQPELSKYASKEKQLRNYSMASPSNLALHTIQQDVLQLHDSIGGFVDEASLVTVMFTLNELYNTSMAATSHLLLSMTARLQKGALLLVVDSPGSYSTVQLGQSTKVASDHDAAVKPTADGRIQEKKYPMHWLLDHILLQKASLELEDSNKRSSTNSRERRWEKIDTKESAWFRLSPKLDYPIKLEDMRYQLHLYRKL